MTAGVEGAVAGIKAGIDGRAIGVKRRAPESETETGAETGARGDARVRTEMAGVETKEGTTKRGGSAPEDYKAAGSGVRAGRRRPEGRERSRPRREQSRGRGRHNEACFEGGDTALEVLIEASGGLQLAFDVVGRGTARHYRQALLMAASKVETKTESVKIISLVSSPVKTDSDAEIQERKLMMVEQDSDVEEIGRVEQVRLWLSIGYLVSNANYESQYSSVPLHERNRLHGSQTCSQHQED